MNHAVFAALCLFGSVSRALAQIPFDVSVGQVAVDPWNTAVLYAGTSFGLFRSIDSGQHWTQAPLPAPGAPQPAIRALAVDRTAPGILRAGVDLAAGGVWSSTDRGATWRPARSGLPAGGGAVTRLYLVPGQPATVYAEVTANSAETRLYRSDDSGASWVLKTQVNGRLTFHTGNPRVLYSCWRFEVKRSDDEGATWRTVGVIRPPAGANDLSGADIEVSPASPQILYASSSGNYSWANGIFVSRDGGASWRRTWEGNCIGVWINPYGPGELFVGPPGSGLLDFLRSADGGSTWSRRSVSASAGAGNRSFGFHPSEAAVVYAATSAGVYRSGDSGLGWTRIGSFRPTLAANPFGGEAKLLADAAAAARLEIEVETVEKQKLALPFTVSVSGEGWLKADKSAGASGERIAVTVDPSGLGEGVYRGVVKISAPGAFNPTQEMPVTLELAAEAVGPGVVVAGYRGARGTAPAGLAFDGKGNLYVSDQRGHTVVRIEASGAQEVVAGSGSSGYSGDGGPATAARLDYPDEVALDSNGFLYILEDFGSRVRQVSPDGTIRTVAGAESGGQSPAEGVPAAAARLLGVRGIAVDSGGSLYLATYDRIWRILPAGTLSRHAGGGSQSAEGSAALNFALAPGGLAFEAGGDLLVSEPSRHRVLRIDRERKVAIVAGTGASGFSGDGGPAREAQLSSPTLVASDAAGNVYVYDSGNRRVRRIGRDGRIQTVAGNGWYGLAADCMPAALAPLERINGLGVDPGSGSLVLAASRTAGLLEIAHAAASGLRPGIREGGVVNAASQRPELAPGGLVAILGSDLAAATAQAGPGPWPAALGGARVCAGRLRVPLGAVSAERITGQFPYGAEPGARRVYVYGPGGVAAPAVVNLAAAAPGMFLQADGRALVVNESGQLNGEAEPAPPGSLAAAYLTGQGALEPPLADGAPAPGDPVSRPLAALRVTVGEREAQVEFAGMMAGQVGVLQVNFRVHEDLEPGDYPLTITVGEAAANSALLRVGARLDESGLQGRAGASRTAAPAP